MVTRPTNIEQGRSIPEIYAEGLRYFMGEGNLNKTLSRLTHDLDDRGIDYMVIGPLLYWHMAIHVSLKIWIW